MVQSTEEEAWWNVSYTSVAKKKTKLNDCKSGGQLMLLDCSVSKKTSMKSLPLSDPLYLSGSLVLEAELRTDFLGVYSLKVSVGLLVFSLY